MRRFLVISFVLILVLAASCGKSQLASTYDTQEKNIESIVSTLVSRNDSATVDRIKDAVRVTVAYGDGPALEKGGAVAFYYAGYYISGSSLSSSNVFATNYETFAKSIKWSVTDSTAFDIKTVRLSSDELVEGLRDGMEGVKGGDECYVLFNGKYGFGKKKIANVPSNSALAYHIWIKSVSND